MKLNVSKPRFLHTICLKSFLVLIVAAMTVAGFSATLRAEDPTYTNSPRVVASATVPVAQASDAGKDVKYPLELLNRSIFDINGLVEVLFFRRAGTLYRVVLPQPVRDSVGNALNNLCSPIILANDILQGEPERAWQTMQRLVINSTLGVVGLLDAAQKMGIPRHDEEFGQTLAIWPV